MSALPISEMAVLLPGSLARALKEELFMGSINMDVLFISATIQWEIVRFVCLLYALNHKYYVLEYYGKRKIS